MKIWLVAFVLVCAGACAVPADANHAQRCGSHGACPNGAACVSGFCLPHQHGPTDHDAAIEGEFDAGTVEWLPDAQVGSQMPPISKRDAGTLPQPPTDSGSHHPVTPAQDAGSSASPDASMLPGSPDCGALGLALCCPWGKLACEGRCVDPLKDKHHCGGCAILCSKGPCKAGICTKDEDDD